MSLFCNFKGSFSFDHLLDFETCNTKGGTEISTGRRGFAGGSQVFPIMSKGLEIELSDFEVQNAMLKGD
jgi:hypothetical protein